MLVKIKVHGISTVLINAVVKSFEEFGGKVLVRGNSVYVTKRGKLEEVMVVASMAMHYKRFEIYISEGGSEEESETQETEETH